MDATEPTAPVNLPIPLDPSFLARHGRRETEQVVRHIVCSVKFELVEESNAIRLLGPETSYHDVDPHLGAALQAFDPEMTLDDVKSYRSSTNRIDLCFEDCWTGYFIADRLEETNHRGDVVIIHLDDHTDLMSTLLTVSGNGLADPTSNLPFNPRSTDDWNRAIRSGAVNIGNYFTPFYFIGLELTIRHLNNAPGPTTSFGVTRAPRRYDLIPDLQFAAIERSTERGTDDVGTYLVGSAPDEVLADLPPAWTIVHIDLDYFIDDFNGSDRGPEYLPSDELRVHAREKMDRFFDALVDAGPTVDRWMIATSPGFCSGFHWRWLLSELKQEIGRFDEASGRPATVKADEMRRSPLPSAGAYLDR